MCVCAGLQSGVHCCLGLHGVSAYVLLCHPCCPARQDAIVPFVMPFVTENIGKKATSEDWRLREAATFAFASILEGPSYSCLANIVRDAMGFLLAVSCMRQHRCLITTVNRNPDVQLRYTAVCRAATFLCAWSSVMPPSVAAVGFLQAMKDPHPYVRDTTAWTIARVFEFQHDVGNATVPELITRDTLPGVVQVCLLAACGQLNVIAPRLGLRRGWGGAPCGACYRVCCGADCLQCTLLTQFCEPCRLCADICSCGRLPVVQVLREALADEPHIAARVCDAIGKLAEGFKDYQGQSSPLSPFFKEIVTVLLQTAQRHDTKQLEFMKMHISAFEAINDMVSTHFVQRLVMPAWRACMRVRHVIGMFSAVAVAAMFAASATLACHKRQVAACVCSQHIDVCCVLHALLQVRAASPDTLDTVGQLTPVFLHEISNATNMQPQSADQREKQAELQGQLCGVLQVSTVGSVHCIGF
jgi:hypothetical protein